MSTPIVNELKEAFADILQDFVDTASDSATDPALFIPKAVDELVAAVIIKLYTDV